MTVPVLPTFAFGIHDCGGRLQAYAVRKPAEAGRVAPLDARSTRAPIHYQRIGLQHGIVAFCSASPTASFWSVFRHGELVAHGRHLGVRDPEATARLWTDRVLLALGAPILEAMSGPGEPCPS